MDNLDLVDTRQIIYETIQALQVARKQLRKLADDKATAIGKYRKARAKVIIELRNGVEKELDGIKIQNPGISLCDSIARGICYQEKITEELATALYKNASTGIDALRAELNGLQSLNKTGTEV